MTSESHASLWSRSYRKFVRDKFGLIGLGVVAIYFVIALAVWMGIIGQNWSELLAEGRSSPSSDFWFGTNTNGQDIFARAIFSTKTAFEIGLVVSIVATALGGVLGAFAGYLSGTVVDEVILWLCGCLDCIPFYLFVAAVAFAMKDQPYAMHISMIATFWMGTCRYIRGEFIKLKHREFVEAAHSVGVKPLKIIFRHIFPNTWHILIVQASLTFVLAIKTEVVLSFLGLGVREGVSWGLMISESVQEVSSGHFSNFMAASLMMFVLVIAFNMFSDALQDALDPRKVL